MADNPKQEQPKKPGFWSRVLSAVGNALGEAKWND